MDILHEINSVVWVIGNLIVLIVFISAGAFTILYPVFFNPFLTTAGKLIWRAIASVAAFGLLVVIGLFVNGRVPWYEYPGDVLWWRPIFRLVVYGFIAYTFASLVALLWIRRFRPAKLVTAPNAHDALAVDLRGLLGTGPGTPDADVISTALIARGWVHPSLSSSPDTLNVKPRKLSRD